eukprot:768576-Hanusia_phi.AAC.8
MLHSTACWSRATQKRKRQGGRMGRMGGRMEEHGRHGGMGRDHHRCAGGREEQRPRTQPMMLSKSPA